jgi:flagellar biogenesis protein FliO
MMEGCCGGMGIGMMLIGLLGVVALILLIVWLVKQIKK